MCQSLRHPGSKVTLPTITCFVESMNREGSAQCPLDASVVGIDDPEEALLAIRDTVAALAAAMQNAN